MNATQAAREIACYDKTLADFVIIQANEINRLRETRHLMEQRIICLQGHDLIYSGELKPYAPEPPIPLCKHTWETVYEGKDNELVSQGTPIGEICMKCRETRDIPSLNGLSQEPKSDG